MRIRHLRYFLIVAEELNFTRAATRAHIEPSPLSRAIKELETYLGVRLFKRNKGHMQLTWAGEVFCEEARYILTYFENSQRRVRAAARGSLEQIRIGLADNLTQPNITKLLARCREEEPQTNIRITEMPFSKMIKALEHDQIDIGFTLQRNELDEMNFQTVWWDRLAVAIPKNHPLLSLEKLPVEEVAKYPLVLCHPEICQSDNEEIAQWCRNITIPLDIDDGVARYEWMMMMVAAGYKIGVGLHSQITLYSQPDVVIRPTTDDVPRIATFMVTRNKPPSDESNELNRFISRAKEIGETEHNIGGIDTKE